MITKRISTEDMEEKLTLMVVIALNNGRADILQIKYRIGGEDICESIQLATSRNVQS